MTIQSVGQQLSIYEPFEIAIDELLTQVEIAQETEVEIELAEDKEE